MSSKFGLQVIDPNAPRPPVENCDVLKPMELAEYRKKRAEWLGWYEFRKDEPNNIEGQIIRMTFLDMSYRMLTKPTTATRISRSLSMFLATTTLGLRYDWLRG